MIVVDSSVWIDFFKGQATPSVSRLVDILDRESVLVGDLILCEVLRGARNDQHALILERALRRYPVVPMLGAEIAIGAAESYRRLRDKGVTVRKTVDLIIGTYCIAHGHTLLHSDRDFDPMERVLGLKVVPVHFGVNEPAAAYG